MKPRYLPKRDKMTKILSDMRGKLDELDDLKGDLEKEEKNTISSEQARSMLEEIKVPELKILKENKN